MRVARYLTPGWILVITVTVSVAAWVMPGESLYLRGFAARADGSVAGWITLLFWYFACWLALLGGSSFGRRVRPSVTVLRAEDDPRFGRAFLITLTVMAATGIVATYSQISSSISISDALQARAGNDLSTSLAASAGLSTLRYATIGAAAIAVVRRIEGYREPILLVSNVGMLALSALVTSRLSVIMCAVIGLYLVSRKREDYRLGVRSIVLLALIGFIALGALNYFRNANYYESFGVSNPAAMNLYQIGTYLGAPAQVSVGVAAQVADGTLAGNVDQDSLAAIRPSFLTDNDGTQKSALFAAGRYGQVSVLRSLNTNSAFADSFVDYGFGGLAFALMGLFGVGAVIGHCGQYRGPTAMGAGAGLYAVAELWRLYLPNQGLFIFSLLSVVAATFIASTWAVTLSRQRPDAGSKPREAHQH